MSKATRPDLFGDGCLIVQIGDDFWLCYLMLLVHESCPHAIYRSRKQILKMIYLVLVSLIVLRAFLIVKSEGGRFSKGIKLVVQDGKPTVFYIGWGIAHITPNTIGILYFFCVLGKISSNLFISEDALLKDLYIRSLLNQHSDCGTRPGKLVHHPIICSGCTEWYMW